MPTKSFNWAPRTVTEILIAPTWWDSEPHTEAVIEGKGMLALSSSWIGTGWPVNSCPVTHGCGIRNQRDGT